MSRLKKYRARRAKPLPEVPGAATRRRLLDVAEELFAERGFSGVSLREIVTQAGVNAAAAHYHFGSKQELFEQVFARRAAPVSEQTIRMLDAAEVWAGDPQFLEQIVTAWFAPSIKGRPQDEGSIRNFNRLRAHIFVENRDFARRLFSEFYTELNARLLAAFQRALPMLPPNELAWRFHVLLGTLVFTTGPAGRLHPIPSAIYSPENPDEAVAYLVPLIAAVFRAPSVRRALDPAESGAKTLASSTCDLVMNN